MESKALALGEAAKAEALDSKYINIASMESKALALEPSLKLKLWTPNTLNSKYIKLTNC